MKQKLHIGVGIALLLISTFLQVTAQTLPNGFSQVNLGTIYYPTSMANAPDGRIFVCEKAGKVKIVKNGSILSTPFLQISVEQTNERGLCGIAVDPDFSNNNYIYIYYTVATNPVHNRISRFTANGDLVVPGSELVLLDIEPVANSIHNGGALAFGSDGKLYIGSGNDNVGSNSQDLNNHKGKILRINKDGSSPNDNPFTGSAAAGRIWAYGLRNPFSISVQPGTGKLFVNDAGESTWEEINDATLPGLNFGWPSAEGNSSNPAYTNPVYAYGHGSTNSTGCAISGGAFFNPSSTGFPSLYTGKYFFVDYCGMWINYIDPAGGTETNFASGLPGSQVSMNTGQDGNLYYFSISQNSLYKISYNAASINSYSASVSSELKISPNPNNGKFTVEFTLSDPSNFTNAEIINATGQVVFTEKLPVTIGSSNLKVELTKDLPFGIYIFKLGNGNTSKRTRFLISD